MERKPVKRKEVGKRSPTPTKNRTRLTKNDEAIDLTKYHPKGWPHTPPPMQADGSAMCEAHGQQVFRELCFARRYRQHLAVNAVCTQCPHSILRKPVRRSKKHAKRK